MTAMDAFFEDCGGRDPLRVELWPRDGGTSVSVEFRKPYILVGRGPGADMGVDNDGTAMRQLYLQLIAGRLYAVQLSEDYPTLQGDDFWRSGWVAPDDHFGIHETNLRVFNPVQVAGPAGPPADSPLSVPPAGEPLYALECGHATDQARQVTSYRPLLLIGRAAPSKVRVRHRTLCPTHAAIVATPRGFWVVDLSYVGGLSVNGEPVSVAPLHHGDVFHCGKVPFRFTLPDHADPVRRPETLDLDPPATAARPRHSAALVNFGPAAVPVGPVSVDAVQVGTVLDQVAQVQQHSFEQFRQMLGTVMQMMSVVMADQRAFVKDELDRMERMMIAMARPPQLPPAPAPTSAPVPPPPAVAPPAYAVPRPAVAPPPTPQNDVHLHNWVETQLQSMQREQDSLWSKLKRRVGGDGPAPG